MCNECGTVFNRTLEYSQVDAEPPDCPACLAATRQDFRPVAVHGVKARTAEEARKIAMDIAVNDYGVRDINIKNREGETNKVTYRDQPAQQPGNWVAPNSEMLSAALADGRATREQYGSGLDVLEGNLKSGVQPDLIQLSKARCMKVW
jgi:hypothetical protein